MWNNLPIREVMERLDTDAACGLTDREADKRRVRYGDNVLRETKRDSLAVLFFSQFKDYMVLVLMAAALISLVTSFLAGDGNFVDPILILAIVVLNAVIGVVQEYRAEQALDALKSMSAPTVDVLRGGKRETLLSSQLVIGDIIYLKTGDFVPADARLLETVGLKADESALTGESLTVDKDAQYICGKDTAVADAKNMVWSSTVVTGGHGKAVVVETGMHTQVGKIAGMLQDSSAPQTPLQEKLAKTGKTLGMMAFAICGLIFGMGLLRKLPAFDLFITSISLAVAAIPEGLPTIVTILLATGIKRMAARNAIVRKLPAVETLGSASVICSDKTGTLTQNKMTVTQVYGNRDLVLDLAALCSNGDGATETAILTAAAQNGFVREMMAREFARVRENPFRSDTKYMSTVHRCAGGYRIIVKGAPDVVLKQCALSAPRQAEVLQKNLDMAKKALRVLAVAYKDVPTLEAATETNLTFAGLIGMMDPPRASVAEAVRLCKRAGIRPVMITGDHIETAKAIARQIGIFTEGDGAMSGAELSGISTEQLADCIDRYSVFARVTPEHKVKIVRALQLRREVVAMTGDGVNDAPALKMADIGCAMGKSGTNVAKEAADIVLTDDNFSTIVAAVREGRTIYGNIKKSIRFLLSSNIGEIVTIFVGIFLGWQAPLAAIHLLWVNFITDSLPAIALGFESAEKDSMEKKPVSRAKGLFSDGIGFSILVEGVMIGTLALIAYSFGIHIYRDLVCAQTMAFMVLSLSQLVHAYNMRSEHSVFKIGVFRNKKLNAAFGICAALQLSVVFFAPVRSLFKVTVLTPAQWIIVAVMSLMPLLLVELEKLVGEAGARKLKLPTMHLPKLPVRRTKRRAQQKARL